jgi:hypothetical protein
MENWSTENQIYKYRGRVGLSESRGGVPKKAVSRSSRKGVVTKKARFEILEALRGKYRLARSPRGHKLE